MGQVGMAGVVRHGMVQIASVPHVTAPAGELDEALLREISLTESALVRYAV